MRRFTAALVAGVMVTGGPVLAGCGPGGLKMKKVIGPDCRVRQNACSRSLTRVGLGAAEPGI